jgi:hypothetical protein
MYTFVNSGAHSYLSGLTRAYGELKACHDRASAAIRDEANLRAQLRDLTEPEPRKGKELEIKKRRAAHTSAMLEARAAFVPLYEAASEMQSELEPDEVMTGFVFLRDNSGERWLSELYDHNVLCATMLLKEAIDTLARYPWDRINLLSSTEASMLPISHDSQLREERLKYAAWLESVPQLLADEDINRKESPKLTNENRWKRWLLLQCLWDVKRDYEITFNVPIMRVMKKRVEEVVALLHARGWWCEIDSFDWLSLKRPEKSRDVLTAKDRLP